MYEINARIVHTVLVLFPDTLQTYTVKRVVQR